VREKEKKVSYQKRDKDQEEKREKERRGDSTAKTRSTPCIPRMARVARRIQ